MNRASALAPAVARFLGDYSAAARRLVLVRALGIAASIFVGWVLACSAADRYLHFGRTVRTGLLATVIFVTAIVILRALIRGWRPVNWVRVAQEIEGRDRRFDQRLITVVSRVEGEPSHRGSDEILAHLSRDLEQLLAETRRRVARPIRNAAGPWALCALLIGVAAALNHWPIIGVPRLLVRAVIPFADVSPVTTTQVSVSPGDFDLVQSQPLRIEVTVERLREDSVILFLNTSGDWYRVAMNPTGRNRFEYNLASVERDVRYYIAAGDAVTQSFTARVLRRPTVERFGIGYEYPAYTRRQGLNVSNTDGLIEAPAGTRATLTVYSSEPLQSALLTVGMDKILMTRTDDPSVFRASFPITHDASYGLDMISTRQVAGGRPAGMVIHAIPMHPPVVRLLQSGFDLRLTPLDIATLTYQATDDYALRYVTLQTEINGRAAIEKSLRIPADARMAGGSIPLDLAQFQVKVGDILSVSVAAGDTAGQVAQSDPLHVLVSTESFDLQGVERAGDMEAAAALAVDVVKAWDNARTAGADADAVADKHSAAFASASSRANVALTHASESAVSLRQALARGVLHAHDPKFCTALLSWINTAQSQTSSADELFRARGSAAATPAPVGQIQQSLEEARALAQKIATVAQGQRSAVTLAAQRDLRAWGKQADHAGAGADRLRQSLRRATEDVALAAKALGLNAGGGDFEAQLEGKIAASEAVIAGESVVDYVALAQSWADGVRAEPRRRTGLAARLAAAAEAEAVRPDADLLWARDLQLASRAAAQLDSTVSEKKPLDDAALGQYVAALSKLQQRRDVQRTSAEQRSADQVKNAQASATEGRRQMLAWAPELDEERNAGLAIGSPSRSTAAAKAAASARRDVEELAMQASAATASHDYSEAGKLDRIMTQRLSIGASSGTAASRAAADQLAQGQENLNQTVAVAREIDGIEQTQERFTADLKVGQNIAQSDLAGREQTVVQAIAAVVTHSSGATEATLREKAAAAFLDVQSRLALVPQTLSDVLTATAAFHAAAARAADAKAQEAKVAGNAPDDQKGVAHRAATQAESDAMDAMTALDQKLSMLAPEQIEGYARQLDAFVPEAMASAQVTRAQLVPAVVEVVRQARAGDSAAVDRASSAVRTAVENVQHELVRAQDAITDRDPLVAAKTFAGAAVHSLASTPPDLANALAQQGRATGALSRAWDQSVHQAAARRLSMVPALQPLYDPVIRGAASDSVRIAASALWSRLGVRDDPQLNLSLHESDPVGYEEPLKIYFDALGKAQAGELKGARQ